MNKDRLGSEWLRCKAAPSTESPWEQRILLNPNMFVLIPAASWRPARGNGATTSNRCTVRRLQGD